MLNLLMEVSAILITVRRKKTLPIFFGINFMYIFIVKHVFSHARYRPNNV